MGHFTVLLGLTLLATSSQALRCLQGSVYIDESDQVISTQFREVSCDGVCTTRIAKLPNGESLHLLGCEQEYRTKKMVLGDQVCNEDLCNAVQGVEIAVESDEDAANPSPSTDAPPASTTTLAPTTTTLAPTTTTTPFECYVGLKHGDYSVGGTELCDGDCATFTTIANGKLSYLFFCAPRPLCRGFLKGKDDGTIVLDGNLNGTCCSTGPNCNADGLVSPMPPLPTGFRTPIACYSGVTLSGKPLTAGSYVACQGDCSSLQYKLVSDFEFTIYGCDPATVCKGFGLKNACSKIDNGTFYGCCCDTDDCIDPTRMPPVSPDNPIPEWLECYNGVHIKYPDHNFDAGAPNLCHGYCASALTYLNQNQVQTFFCADAPLCKSLESQDGCDVMQIGDQQMLVCCCNDAANCNTKGKNIPTFAPATVVVPQMIACYQGLWINNQSYTGDFIACDGDCASVTLPTTMNTKPFEVTLYTCDPATVCRDLGIINNCAKIDNTISGCCCDTDVCINPLINKFPSGNFSDDLHCLAGIVFGTGKDAQVIGGSVACDGECASFKTNITGVPAGGYFCAPRSLCHKLGVHNDCAFLPGSQSTSGCCCDWDNDCNAKQDNITVPPYVPSNKPPLACYSGLSYNGTMLRDADRYMTCRGDCGAITFTTTISGTQHSITMYSCDPTNVCDTFKLKNSCGTVGNDTKGNTITGCCCSWNDCIDLDSGQIKPTHDNLQCYVGTGVVGKNGTFVKGQTAACPGKCGSIQTMINNAETWSFFCASTLACSLVETDNGPCSTLFTDAGEYIQGCCCDDSDNCNLKNTDVVPSSLPPTVIPDNRSPIACYSGFSINGTILTPPDSYLACHGDCASISYQSIFNQKSVVTTIYSCDPASYCRDLGMSNSCQQVQNGDSPTTIYGCCCDWDDCIDTNNNGMIKPSNNTRPDNLECLVGYSIDFGGTQGDQFYGASMPCEGTCASVEITVLTMYMTGYLCAPNSLCTSLDLENSCNGLVGQHNIEGCCCDNALNCNNKHNLTVPPYTPPTKSPIACYSGLAVNGNLLTDANQYMACRGDCGLFNFHTTAGGTDLNTTLFACDPVSVCDSLGLKDSCNSLGSVIDGCCCGFNDCIDIDKRTIKPSRDSLQCFSGIATEGSAYNSTVGTSTSCDGQCASIASSINGQATWMFFCASNKLCDALDPTSHCTTLFTDNQDFLEGCCCSDDNNCNINMAKVDPAPSLPPAPSGVAPITCYSGIAFNGSLITPVDSYQACSGDCSAITYTSSFKNKTIATTVFTCDPSTLCTQLGMDNKCANIQSGNSSTTLSGCCCTMNDCIDLSTGQLKPQPTQPLPAPTKASSFISLLFVFLLPLYKLF